VLLNLHMVYLKADRYVDNQNMTGKLKID